MHTTSSWSWPSNNHLVALSLAFPILLLAFFVRLLPRNVTVGCRKLALANKIRKAKDFAEICEIFAYIHEDHTITTKDGYILRLHRIVAKKGASNGSQPTGSPKPVVFINHGLLTNSELYMAVADARKCLPLVLVDCGYDVWLGNNRGNKYSQDHVHKKPDSAEFWDFCIDDFARYDMPNSVDFVLKHTRASSLSYVGFSQGTAQAFAALSIHPELNDKINVFVALAPIMHPSGYASPFIDAIVKKNPAILFRLFGRRSMFPSVAFWQSVLPTFFLHLAMDFALVFLLGFHNHNITKIQKTASYTHIYCSSSVKTVVHWAQIMRDSAFGTYQSHDTAAAAAAGAVSRYLTHDIRTPMVLIYGGRDSLFHLDSMLEKLPPKTTYQRLEDYEHIDVLWGDRVDVDVIPKVLRALSR